jgi:hypothetical protein
MLRGEGGLTMTPFDKSPEGMFLDEALAVLKAINARTAVLLAEYEHIKRAVENENRPAEKADGNTK